MIMTLILIWRGGSSPPCALQAHFKRLDQSGILQCSSHTLLIVQLLVHWDVFKTGNGGTITDHKPPCSLLCDPGLTLMSTLNRSGSARRRRTRIEKPGRKLRDIPSEDICEDVPMSVDMPQCGTVGVNSTNTRFRALSTVICGEDTTANISSVIDLCSGSLMERIRSARSHGKQRREQGCEV